MGKIINQFFETYDSLKNLLKRSHFEPILLTIKSLIRFQSHIGFKTSKMSSNTTSTVILRGPDDWDKWDKQFRTKAVAYSLWEHIDPEARVPKAFLTEPEEPKLRDYPTGTRESTVTEGESQSQGCRRQQRGSTVMTIADLTLEGQKAYQLAWTVYTHRLKQYTDEKNNIREFKNWVTSSIAPHYFDSTCEPTESLRVWYENIIEHSGVSEGMIITAARDKYKEAVVVLRKPPKDFDAWLNNWEQAMSHGQRKKVPEAQSISSWFDDFLHAVEPVMGYWTTSYRLTKQSEVDSGSLTYRILANDFRKELRHRKGNTSSGKTAKGSFGASFGPKTDCAEGDAPTSQGAESSSSTGQRAERRSIRRHKRAASENQEEVVPENQGTRPICPVCNLKHQLLKCYYAFPELAPDGFQPREFLQKRAEENLQKKEVIDQLRKIKNKRHKPGDGEEDKTD